MDVMHLILWSYASVERLVFRNIENGLFAIKATYNYNKYNHIHTHRSLYTSPLPTLLYPRTRNNPLPCYLCAFQGIIIFRVDCVD